MASTNRSRGWVALLGGAAFTLAVASGCGSSSSKRTTQPSDAGAAGEASNVAGAAGSEPIAGAAPVGSAGQAGEAGSEQGGSAGVDGEAGAAGLIPSPACMPSGQVSGLVTSTETIYQACRGAVVHVPFEIEQSAPEFACCATSSAETPWGALLNATAEEGQGEFVFAVPHDAPFGNQGLALSCASGPIENSIGIEINDGDAPMVDEISTTVVATAQMTVKGAHLAGVTQVYATKPGGGMWPCAIDSESTDSMLLCVFGSSIPLSETETDFYRLFVASDDCGFAADTYQFLVIPPQG